MNKPKKETVGTRYFLIAFGNFKNNQELMMNLFKQFTPVLSSNVLKFHFGDDYVTKPYSKAELVARIKAVLRRQGDSESGEGSLISAGPVKIDVRIFEPHLNLILVLFFPLAVVHFQSILI